MQRRVRPYFSSAVIGVTTLLLVVLFQNCSLRDLSGGAASENTQKLGGEGYGGKTYTHYGECGSEQIQLKSVAQYVSGKGLSLVREHCTDLQEPRALDEASFLFSSHDPALLVANDAVFDQVPLKATERRLTTAYCQATDASLEVMVWFLSDANEKAPDPRAASELYGRVLKKDGGDSGIVLIRPPAIYTDKLVYLSKDPAAGFELTQTRDGKSSTLTYSLSGSSPQATTVTCHSQAAPRFLEPNIGYFLKLAPEFSAKENFAVISHDQERGLDLFKIANDTDPVASANSLLGWSSGYVSIGKSVYQMRKTGKERICFAPADQFRSPCHMRVLGEINSDEFGDLYERRSDLARKHLRILLSASRTERTIRARALTVDNAASVLRFLNEPRAHARLKAALIGEAGALVDILLGSKSLEPMLRSHILNALARVHAVTGEGAILSLLQREWPSLKSNTLPVNPSDLRESAHYIAMASQLEEVGVPAMDPQIVVPLLVRILSSQVLEKGQSGCAGDELAFGSWPVNVDFPCTSQRAQPAPLIRALLGVQRYLGKHRICEKASRQNWQIACTATSEALLAQLTYLYNFPWAAAQEDGESGPDLFRPVVFVHLLEFAIRSGLSDSDPVQSGFSAGETVSIGEIKKASAEYNKNYFNSIDPRILPQAMMEARIAELIANQ